MIGDEINCLKNIGPIQLSNANSQCQSLNASQILPRNSQESDDLVLALLSMNLSSYSEKVLVSIGIYKTKGIWYDTVGRRISYSNWLPGEPDFLSGSLNYAGFRFGGVNESAGWADYGDSDELIVICTKKAGHGKNYWI